MSDFKYGQGYSDWHKYAGYVDKNTDQFNFGEEPISPTEIKPVVPPKTESVDTPAIPAVAVTPSFKPISFSAPTTLSPQNSSLLDTFMSLGGK